MDASQFVAALFENMEDAAVWQYYDKFDEARKVEGGIRQTLLFGLLRKGRQ